MNGDWACLQRVGASAGAEKTPSQLRPEKTWFVTRGRGFDSRHLHYVLRVLVRRRLLDRLARCCCRVGYTPLCAMSRPDFTALTKTLKSRSFWSAYAAEKSAIARSKASPLPR